MPSEAQQELFKRLTEQRTFPEGTDTAAAIEQFATLDGANASKWIEKALELPERGIVPPPF